LLAPNPEPAEHTVLADEAGLRADVLVARLAAASRSAVAAAFKAGDVLINGVPVKPSTLLAAEDVVAYHIAVQPPLEAFPEAIPLDVVFEDETIVVVNKAPGMVTHPAHGATSGTLVNALLAHAGALPGEALRAGLVHRLDRDTSGLLVVAKTPKALSTLGKAMQKRYIQREYRGIVAGIPADAEGTIEGAIGRDPRNRQRYAIRTEGKPAITHYALRERLQHAAELTFRLETGRTHQIRVHLAAVGHPLLNDPVYGRRDSRIALPGQALHAWRLAFRHPATMTPLELEDEPPQAYLDSLAALRA
jgi:23S rRNA pseudouridine1911/1915/1917 synthase